MGVVLLRDVVDYQMVRPVAMTELVGRPQFPENFERDFQQPRSDYRHILVTRDFYDALVSGYLYHKSHLECDRDWYGRPGHHGWLYNNSQEDWENRINRSATKAIHPWPSGRGRDLCTYLSEESEKDGIRVYIEWAKHIFLDPLVSFARSRLETEKTITSKKTLFMCYEQLVANFSEAVAVMGLWMFPGMSQPVLLKSSGLPRNAARSHATEKDPALRDRLKQIISKLDRKLYKGSIKLDDEALFGCRAKSVIGKVPEYHTLPVSEALNSIRKAALGLPQKSVSVRTKENVCDCSETLCTAQYCHRGIIRVHKMGVTVTNEVANFQMIRQIEATQISARSNYPKNFIEFQKPVTDYRHVLLTRDFYESLISGYLYHKAHRECDLDWFGGSNRTGWLYLNSEEDWEQRINQTSTKSIRSWPAGLGRDLCTYLSDESEEDGLRVYVEWAKSMYLDPLVSFARSRRELERRMSTNKTLFMCYEQLASNYSLSVTTMAFWMFPGVKRPARVKIRSLPMRDARGHATVRDPDTRDRLLEIIRDLDRQLFNGTIELSDKEIFGCRAKRSIQDVPEYRTLGIEQAMSKVFLSSAEDEKVDYKRSTKKRSTAGKSYCLDPDADSNYCHRGIIRVHKMGLTMLDMVAVYQMFKPVHATEVSGRPNYPNNFVKFQQPKEDYRHVLVTRDFYDSLLSGYLYHKAHRECDLDWYGRPNHTGWLYKNAEEDWEKRINVTAAKHVLAWSPGRGRDLCSYLSDESEEDGLRVYMEWAKDMYLDPLVAFVESRKEWEQSKKVKKTLFMCYEQLMANYTQAITLMGLWMFPGHPAPARLKSIQVDKYDAGGHATEGDPVLRNRLLEMIAKLDEKLFKGIIKRADDILFGCSSKNTIQSLPEYESLFVRKAWKASVQQKALRKSNLSNSIQT